MKMLAQTLGVMVGIVIVLVGVAIGYYDREASKPKWWDSYDNGAHDL